VTGQPRVSVVVPAHDEAGAIGPLAAEIARALANIPHEIVVVDDGSRDGTVTAALASGAAGLRVLRHPRRLGQSAALVTGVLAARAPVVVTLDGDGQNDPADIAALLDRLDGAALVAGVRRRRRDSVPRRIASRIANGIRRAVLRDGAVDTGCGLRAFRRETFLALPRFDHMHRFLPALFLAVGQPVAFVAVEHRPRTQGRSKYGVWDRVLVGLVDLWGVAWLKRRALPPASFEEVGDGR
jgi:dolichol-phosphate mannosyltransferase